VQATEICIEDDFIQQETRKSGANDKGPQTDKHSKKHEEREAFLHHPLENRYENQTQPYVEATKAHWDFDEIQEQEQMLQIPW